MFLTIRYFLADLQYLFESKEDLTLGGKRNKGKTTIRVFAQVIITIVILATCVPVVVKQDYSSETKQIASGLLGTVIGYWFR